MGYTQLFETNLATFSDEGSPSGKELIDQLQQPSEDGETGDFNPIVDRGTYYRSGDPREPARVLPGLLASPGNAIEPDDLIVFGHNKDKTRELFEATSEELRSAIEELGDPKGAAGVRLARFGLRVLGVVPVSSELIRSRYLDVVQNY